MPTKPTYEVQRGEVIKTLEFTGRVAPVVEEELFFRASGYVEEIFVERNAWVQAGDVLAELEVTDLKNQLAQAEAALESAVANYEQRVAEAEAALHIAELGLAITQADDPDPQVVIAEVGVERAKAFLDEQQRNYEDALAHP